jgi:hypothetical protein
MIDDNKAKTQWSKANISYNNYIVYIGKKINKFELTLIDLLYISNFKGGNSTINEDELIIKNKLITYSKYFKEIDAEFGSRKLVELNDTETNRLIEKVKDLCSLTKKNTESKIDGFSVSYLSALLNCYFPNLLPILDRRILINLGIVTKIHRNKQGQIKDIEAFYEILIRRMKEEAIRKRITIREIDKDLFKVKIQNDKI